MIPKHEQTVSTKLNAMALVDLALPNITQHNDLTGQLSRLYGRVGQRQNRTHPTAEKDSEGPDES